jgi:hypothetical protein
MEATRKQSTSSPKISELCDSNTAFSIGNTAFLRSKSLYIASPATRHPQPDVIEGERLPTRHRFHHYPAKKVVTRVSAFAEICNFTEILLTVQISVFIVISAFAEIPFDC